MKSNRPAYATRSKTVEFLIKTQHILLSKNSSDEVHKTELSTSGKAEHDNHVTGEICSYTTQFSDQNITNDQRYLMYAFKATSDPDTLYLHEVTITIDWP